MCASPRAPAAAFFAHPATPEVAPPIMQDGLVPQSQIFVQTAGVTNLPREGCTSVGTVMSAGPERVTRMDSSKISDEEGSESETLQKTLPPGCNLEAALWASGSCSASAGEATSGLPRGS